MLRKINNVLLGAIIIINGYSLATPYLPALRFWVENRDKTVERSLTLQVSSDAGLPDDNRLIIPKLRLSEPINEGQSVYTLNKGIWRRPGGSAPDKGSNTVLTGHRFTYRGQAVFYHLDLVKPGDELAVFWNRTKYVYRVREVKIVPPSDISVEASTSGQTLTLYTCTPVWTAKDRLVVIAERTSL